MSPHFLYLLLFTILLFFFFFFFFNDTATTEIYTLSLHDALPICFTPGFPPSQRERSSAATPAMARAIDRKSTRLNSSHRTISYAVFCLKKKKKIKKIKTATITNRKEYKNYTRRIYCFMRA